MGWTVEPSVQVGGAGNVYVQQTAPTGTIPVGSLWMQTDASNHIISVNQWDGTTWVSQVFNATNTVEAGTIIASLLAAGIVVAGIINGTTVNAATFNGSVFNGTNWTADASGTRWYSGTPALGNLIASDSNLATAASTTTDSFGNVVYAGRCAYSASGGATPTFIIQLFNGQMNISTPAGITHAANASPASFSGGAPGIAQVNTGVNSNTDVAASLLLRSTQQGLSGVPEIIPTGVLYLDQHTPTSPIGAGLYADSSNRAVARLMGDSNNYTFGVSDHRAHPAQLINSTTFSTIDSATFAVLSGIPYYYKAMVIYHGTQNAGNPIISFAHPNTNTYTDVAAHEEWSVSGSAPSQTNTDLSFLDVTGPALTTGRFCYKSEGFFTPSANQNFTLSAACSVAADTYTIDAVIVLLQPIL